MKQTISKNLAKEGINAEIHARKKHLYALWKKLKRPEIDGNLEKIHDIVALRIIVGETPDCYLALGIVHGVYKPIPYIGISDFIAQPKPNGYRSIHTKVFGPKDRAVEVQIRTHQMHEQAEFGIAAHWSYSLAKRKGVKDELLEKGRVRAPKDKIDWVKQLVKWQKDIRDSGEFLKAVKFDAFRHRNFIFSPKGDVFDLPAEATPVDFAYAVHTDLGEFIKSAKVNGKMVPLSAKLKSGDVVEIIKTKNPIKPSHRWLEFVKTTLARREIQKSLKGQSD
jgi:GTP pyrophosphokinase